MMNSDFKLRIKALFIDYFCIVLYLLILFTLTMSVYYVFFSRMPEFTESTTQWISLLTTILPVTIYYTIKESKKPFASFGKKKVGLMVKYVNKPIIGSMIRNVFKFLPWQFGHMAVIRGIYTGFDSWFAILFYGLAIILPIIYIVMAMIRSDHRHIPDLLAGSYVVIE